MKRPPSCGWGTVVPSPIKTAQYIIGKPDSGVADQKYGEDIAPGPKLKPWSPSHAMELDSPAFTRLSHSDTFGKRQIPAVLPSVSPQSPFFNPLTAVWASGQYLPPKQAVSFSQTRLVSLSVIVPLLLSVNLGEGHGTPLFTSPSCPVAGNYHPCSIITGSLAGLR
jgi:hypothetical protein